MEVIVEKGNHDVKSLVEYYFKVKPKLKYKHICSIITEVHQLPLTLRRLKEILRCNGLTRSRNVNDSTLQSIIINELGMISKKVGYRQFTEMISIRYGVNIAREDVRKKLLSIDPDGVALRRRGTIKRRLYFNRGPMDVVHLDGNDKLKRYGFALHGAIDGFSRKLLWLTASTTNNDPLVIGNYYLSFIERLKKVPQTLRMDLGTENVYCEELQKFFTGSDDSFLYASSTRNQRIEAFWSRLKKFNLEWWIDFFEDMIHRRIHKPSCILHKEALIFCFLPVIQSQLNECIRMWNTRQIRQSAAAPGGVPEVLFNIPSTVGFKSQAIDVTPEDSQVAKDVIGIAYHPVSKNEDIHELFLCYINLFNINIPQDAENALSSYIDLLECLDNDGFVI